MKRCLFALYLLLVYGAAIAQPAPPFKAGDTVNYSLVYGLAVKGEIPAALAYLDSVDVYRETDQAFKKAFEDRFKFESDRSLQPINSDTPLHALHRIFQQYWRSGLLHGAQNFDSSLLQDVLLFLQQQNQRSPFTHTTISPRTLPSAFQSFVRSNGYQCTDLGKTGKFYDFIAWKESTPKTYTIALTRDSITVTVNFLSDFVSLGWLEYSRLGNYYPGGWATKDSLYCVAKGYDTTSERFRIHFLSHEGQHFWDYSHFPELASNDLEYRAKLVEIYRSEKDLYTLLEKFMLNAKNDKTNAHPFANYCLMRNLSRLLGRTGWKFNGEGWKTVPTQQLRQAALQLLEEHTEALEKQGKDVTTVLF